MHNPAICLLPAGVKLGCGYGRHNQSEPHVVYRKQGYAEWILEYSVSGQAYVRGGGQEINVGPGEVLLFEPKITQDYGMDKRLKAWEHYWVTFNPYSTWSAWLNWPRCLPGVLRIALPREEQRRAMLQRSIHIQDIMRGPLPHRAEFAMNALEELLLWCDTANPQSGLANLDTRIQRGLEFLCQRHQERIDLSRLAKVCHLSSSRLSHLFKAQLGVTPMQYLEEHRMQKAQELLLMTSKTVSQVAYAVGFQNPLYFSRIFRRRVGQSPRAYRKQQ